MTILGGLAMGFMVGGFFGGLYVSFIVPVVCCFLAGIFATLAAILYKGQAMVKDLVGLINVEVSENGKPKRKQDGTVGQDH